MTLRFFQELFNTSLFQERETTRENREMKLQEIKEDLPLSRRWKASSSQTINKWSPDSNVDNPLNEPSPLGLKLTKSPSFCQLIEKMLNQAHSLPSENLQVGNKKDVKARVGTSDPIDKLKASNFPALRLKIGDWEYVSQHEGDLVAKCYFAKHKLVWEVLDGGLKNKIEIQWEDIISLKANFPENGPGTLAVKLGREPLYFRETNPQPRKHTIWQATSDFTRGEAHKNREHYLQCAPGVLNKHYEKLIHCDTRLNFLSQQFDMFSGKPFLEASIMAPHTPCNIVSNRPDTDINNVNGWRDGNYSSNPQAIVLSSTPQGILTDTNSAPNDTAKRNVSGWRDVNYNSNPKDMVLYSPTSQGLLRDTNSAPKDTDKNNNVNGWGDGNYYSNPEGMVLSSTPQGILTDTNSAPKDTDKNNNVNGWREVNYNSNPVGMVLSSTSQGILRDTNSAPKDTDKNNNVNGWREVNYDSNPKDIVLYSPTSPCLRKEVNSDPEGSGTNYANGLQDGNYYTIPASIILSSTLQVVNSFEEDTEKNDVNGWHDGNYFSSPDCNPPSDDYLIEQGFLEEVGNVYGFEKDLGISRKDSLADFLDNLPNLDNLPPNLVSGFKFEDIFEINDI